MYLSRTDSVFLSQTLHISMWHHSGTGGRIRILKRAKSLRIEFTKPSAHCLIKEIIFFRAGSHSMPQLTLEGYHRVVSIRPETSWRRSPKEKYRAHFDL